MGGEPAVPGETRAGRVTVDIENVGGITQQTLEFEPGITVLTGENATNRTSMLRSIMAACGSDRAYLKAGAERGAVRLTVGEETYSRWFEREKGGVRTGGSPLLADENRIEAADHYAFLLADNGARLAVLDPETDLRDVVMAPVDTDAIEARIDRLRSELEAAREAVDRRDRLRNERLPSLETEQEELRTEVGRLEARIEEAEAELEEADEDVETSKEQRERIDGLTSRLGDAREERDRFDRRIEAESDALDEARSEHEEVRAELDSFDAPDESERAGTEERLDELRSRREALDERINTLMTIVSFNEERLDGGGTIGDAVAKALGESVETDPDRSGTAAELTRQLAEPAEGAEAVRCWTCGQEARREQLEATVGALREEIQDRRATRSELEARIEELEAELDSIEAARRERRRLRERADSLEESVAAAEDRIESLTAQREAAAERVEELEEAVAELETDDEAHAHVIELHREITELETEKRQAEDRLGEVTEEVEAVREQIEELDGVEGQRAELEEELERQRHRIDTIREDVVDAFNENMDTLLAELGYENVERVWLERRREEVREGRQTVEETVFDLHVVRETEAGAVFEDAGGTEHLSESERNVVGLVFALAGYLAHDVHESVPFVLLDSLEAIDAERISTLIQHFEGHAAYLVAALLPEDREPLLTEVEPETVVRVGSSET
jgi:predicted  nucleic acid-binding Zn-ribbon protein